jgi:FkbM family methyltransferase
MLAARLAARQERLAVDVRKHGSGEDMGNVLSRARGLLLGGVERVVANVPGAQLAREALVGSVGSWLYRRPTLSWLSEPALARQLPSAHRLFARYCAAQRGDPIGAETFLRVLIALSRLRRRDSGIAPLCLSETKVFLDLWDPRFLRVPTELADARGVLRNFLRPGDTFVDVGANHGSFSIAASSLVGRDGLVIALEPQPRLAGLVQRSLACGPASFEVHQVACGDRNGAVDLHIPRATSGAAGVFGAYSAAPVHRTVTVPMRRLDDLLDGRALTGRTFVKLDVEGSEMAVLRGAERILRGTTPAVLLEINARAMRAAGTPPEGLRQLLLDLGYDRFATPREPCCERPLADAALDATEGDVIVLPKRGT